MEFMKFVKKILNFSYTDLFPPVPMFHRHSKQLTVSGNNVIFKDNKDLTFVPTYMQPVECVLQLGKSYYLRLRII